MSHLRYRICRLVNPPFSFAFSDTMSKLDRAKIFIHLLVQHMRNDDYLGIVTFGTTAKLVSPLVIMSEDNKVTRVMLRAQDKPLTSSLCCISGNDVGERVENGDWGSDKPGCWSVSGSGSVHSYSDRNPEKGVSKTENYM